MIKANNINIVLPIKLFVFIILLYKLFINIYFISRFY